MLNQLPPQVNQFPGLRQQSLKTSGIVSGITAIRTITTPERYLQIISGYDSDTIMGKRVVAEGDH